MPERRIRFAFVSNVAEIGNALMRAADPGTDDIVVRRSTMEHAVPVARELLDSGVEVILAGGGTGGLLAQTLGHPVVKISRSYLDLLRALAATRKYGTHIGLTSFHAPAEGMDLIEQLLGIRIRQIVFNTSQQLEEGISAAISEKVECIVGSGVCKQIANRHGCEAIVAMPGAEKIEQALVEARALAMARRRERHELDRAKAILRVVKDSLIVVDADGRLEFANSAAHELFPRIDSAFASMTEELGIADVLNTGRPRNDRVCQVGGRAIVGNVLPIEVDGEIDGAVAIVSDASRVHRIDRHLKEKLYHRGFVAKHTVSAIKGSSSAIQRVLHDLRSYARTDANLLLQGETGVGKELLAQSVHNLSGRRAKPFVAVNCSALPEALLESELFGYEEGAFTGARRGGKIGLFELAQNGSLFLDEIADVSPHMQAKLLRVLEEKELMRVGGSEVIRINVRIIASSYKNLYSEVKTRHFRGDLYFRLATLQIVVPPLRDRVGDLPVLIGDALGRHGRSPDTISGQMIERLCRYGWPGNVRELEALIERYVALLGDEPRNDSLLERLAAELEDLTGDADCVKSLSSDIDEASNRSFAGLREMVGQYEQRLIAETLRSCQYSRHRAAKKLGISLNTLWRKMPPDLRH